MFIKIDICLYTGGCDFYKLYAALILNVFIKDSAKLNKHAILKIEGNQLLDFCWTRLGMILN